MQARSPRSLAPAPVLVAGAALASFAGGCAAADVVAGAAMDAGRRWILDAAGGNYDLDYNGTLERLVDGMIELASPTPDVVAPGTVSPGVVAAYADDGAAAPAAAPTDDAPPRIELEVLVMKEVLDGGRPTPLPLADGAVVRDGVARAGDGDNLKIQLSTSVTCHLYAVWIDATGWATPVFPVSEDGTRRNPVAPGETITVPEGSRWFFLDEYRGVENLFVVASHEPRDDLREALDELVGRERTFRDDVGTPTTLARPQPMSRGIAGVRPGTATDVRTTDGATHDVTAPVFLAEFAGSDAVVHRWFLHE